MKKIPQKNLDNRLAMSDITQKEQTFRLAKAQAVIRTTPQVLKLIKQKKIPKGDVLITAQIAGITAAKNTSAIIPLCHPLQATHIDLKIEFKKPNRLRIECAVSTIGRTGPDMEALTAVAAAGLTIYDMCKSIDRAAVIEEILLLEKTGGKSGTYKRDKK